MRKNSLGIVGGLAALVFLCPAGANAQEEQAVVPDVVCGSQRGERQTCAAETGGGVTILRSIGPGRASWAGPGGMTRTASG
jgi:hypothetical protein